MEEVWKPVVGYPGYEVSCHGRLRSLRRVVPRVLKGQLGSHGYLQSLLVDENSGKKHYVAHHVAVALAFLGPREVGRLVRHRDGVKTNNKLPNLRWGTYRENALDMHTHGTMRCGDSHEWSKLTDVQVLEISEKLKAGSRVSDLAKEYEVAHGVISGINRGSNRAYLTGRVATDRKPTRAKKLTVEQVDDIVLRLRLGELQKNIATLYGVKRQTISCIATGKVWSWRTGLITKVIGEA